MSLVAVSLRISLFLSTCVLIAWLMSKGSKSRKHKATAPTLQSQPVERSGSGADRSKRRTVRDVIDWLAIVLSVLSAFLWLPSFLPDIHIDHRGTVSSTNPFETPFAITNNGLSAVFDLRYYCKVDFVYYLMGATVNPPLSYTVMVRGDDRLGRGETADLICLGLKFPTTRVPVVQAQIEIGVTFVPRLIHKRMRVCSTFWTHFAGTKIEEGLDWLQRPERDPNRCATIATY